MNHYLTFDYGTTSIKAGLIDAELKMLAQCIEEYDLITDGGRIEMNSEDYWDAMCRAVAHLKRKSRWNRSPLSALLHRVKR